MPATNETPHLTDDALLAKLGHGLARTRIRLNLTQEELARQAGLGKRTVERLEKGHSVQMAGFLRVLRVLGLLAELDAFIPAEGPTPMEQLKQKSKQRYRASAPRTAVVKETTWKWGDEP